MPPLDHYVKAIASRVNARRLGVHGTVPPGSVVRGGAGLAIGRGFYASGKVWIEGVLEYEGATFAPVLSVGSNVRTSPRLHVSAIHEVTIGDWVLFGENVFVSDHQHGATSGDGEHADPGMPPALRPLGGARAVSIGDRCHLGNNVVVLPGASIGEGSIVGANSVVSGDIPANSIVVGAPARVVKTWNTTTRRWER